VASPAASGLDPIPERLLLLDLDGCLQAPEAAGLDQLRRRLAADPRSGLGVLSGRSFQAARHRYADLQLVDPSVWITQAGTEIRLGPGAELDLLWQQQIAPGWDRQAVLAALAELEARLRPQAEAQQGPFKLSYLLRPPPAGALAIVRQTLRQRRLEARAQLVQHWYLDVLPPRASSAEAIRHLSLRWGLPLDRFLLLAPPQEDAEGLGRLVNQAGRARFPVTARLGS
jgi:sucrose-phosphate synthase